ncbi:ATP-binding protein [Collinsella sp. zg1085]|uniref:ATP-binding protein n=1 Tax=Collinsella sp. zg1085 TaxID=2844380 RepID=UPI001C0D8814|nr:ATP-binding protein [Collinsella sp. zg1085]QWT17680.1 ATP-binding protein [Collinsella sp. zg1085]
MERFLMNKLIAWKNKPNRKPLILNGARQVGKTWLLKEFGKEQFENVAYVNLDNNPRIGEQFELGYDIPRIISAIQFETGQVISEDSTLIILDEIQAHPKALTSLKYFYENAPKYAVAAAGSLLGITIHEGSGYPVGKVDTLDLYPLHFREFLVATGNRALCDLIESDETDLINSFSSKLVPLLRQYYYVGGMPEAVNAFLTRGLLEETREVQLEILRGYERDISKHLGRTETEYALATLKSIPAHLGRENKKFVFSHIAKGARARNYRSGITWLTQAGIATLVHKISKPSIPLAPYTDDASFKLFLVDVGLLGAMAQLDKETVIGGNSIFKEFKGSLTEQFVCQQLVSDCGLTPYYWSAENSIGEIDFLVQKTNSIFAIEVKAEENLRSKSLRAFKNAHLEVEAVRFSLSGYREQDWMKNIPLYAMTNMGLWS